MADVINAVSGNKMFQLKQGIKELCRCIRRLPSQGNLFQDIAVIFHFPHRRLKPFWMEGDVMHGNGFTFANYSFVELRERTGAAIALWRNLPLRQRLMRRIMETDFSWGASAGQYLALYRELL